ncbi:Spore cortex-lytic enzyme precursor [Paraliobacillus sp. PM-2]|uniref:cell wall hydrolase n=1 Tax=Paraliobacillus sp. PM-2 TaxID=1462524 RepID=UPI00061C84DD|nr:cell wall hydrolase [Paraliobacillus sp. PM-2]CQR47977.1 Spore cortex-lytic enzyme precursor [Paraliobacillus sp. PM-2]
MKNIKNILLTIGLSLTILLAPSIANAATYTVKSGDSLWKISNHYGVSVSALQQTNHLKGITIYPGQLLTLPTRISNQEMDLLARLVHAEAKGEPYAGKVAVATVVLNRVDHSDFPNTIKEVIYQRSAGGYYAFTPVKNDAIYQPADSDAKRAVQEALAFRGQGQGSIYFYNPKTAKSDWILSRTVTITIGNHRFAK